MPVSPARHFKCLVSTNFTTRAMTLAQYRRSGYNVPAASAHPYVSSPASRRARVAVRTDKSQVGDVVVMAMPVDVVQFEGNIISEPFREAAHRASGFEQMLGQQSLS